MCFKFYYNIRLSVAMSLLLAVGTATLMLSGCKDDLIVTDDYDGRPADSYSVSIALAGMGVEQTRAEENESTADTEDRGAGTPEDTYIDIDDLYVMTFSIAESATELSADSKLLEVLWNGKEKGKKKGSGIHYNGNTAYLHTWLDHNITEYNYDSTNKKDFCLVAVANFSQFKKTDGKPLELKKDMTFGALQDALKYDFTPNTIVTNDETEDWYWLHYSDENGVRVKRGFPLFGVKQVNLAGYDKAINNFANPFTLYSNGNPTLWLLRAFSKIEIMLDPDLCEEDETNTAVSLSSASVNNRFASQFWVIPELTRMDAFKNGNNKGNGETADVTKVPTDLYNALPSALNKSMHFSISDDRRSGVIYLPETALKVDDDALKIELILQRGDEVRYFSFMVKQNNSQEAYWMYLLRNHSYRFLVSMDRVFSVEPQPWENAFDNEFTFGTPTEEPTEEPEQTEQDEN